MNRRHLAVAVAATAALAPSRLGAQVDDAQCTYKGKIVAITDMLKWFLDEVRTQSTGVTDANFADEQWKVDVLAPFAVAQAAQAVLATLDPPSGFADAHALVVQSVDELVEAQAAMERGVLEVDLAAITEATQHMTNANALMTQAAQALPA